MHVGKAFNGKATRSSATAKSSACPSCLVGVLYDIFRDKSVDG